MLYFPTVLLVVVPVTNSDRKQSKVFREGEGKLFLFTISMRLVLPTLLAATADALLTNTDWRIMLNIGGETSASGILPLPLALRFAGDEIASQVDGLLKAPKRLEALSDTASIITGDGEHTVPLSAIGWTEDVVDRKKSLVTWCVEFPDGAARAGVSLPPGRVYCSAKLWQAADFETKKRALNQLESSMADLETTLNECWDNEGLKGLLSQLAARRRLDERIVSLEEEVPDADVVPVPGDEHTLIARKGDLSVRREPVGMAGRLACLLGGTSAEYVQIGTFSLRPIPHEPSPPAAPAHAGVATAAAGGETRGRVVPTARSGVPEMLGGQQRSQVGGQIAGQHRAAGVARRAAGASPRAHSPRMGLFDGLPGFWKSPIPVMHLPVSPISLLPWPSVTFWKSPIPVMRGGPKG